VPGSFLSIRVLKRTGFCSMGPKNVSIES
jgi:hypothetical protein